MSFHTGQSFTFGETPSATKWNYLWENDYALADGTGLEDDIIDSRHYVDGSIDFAHLGADIAGFQLLADVTLGVAGDTISSGTVTARKYIKLIWAPIATGGTNNGVLRFNNDSGNNYNLRYSDNGGADGTTGATTGVAIDTGAIAAVNFFGHAELVNFSANEKIVRGWGASSGAAGAANAPGRREFVCKWANTSVQATRFDVLNTAGTGDFAIGSRLLVYGRD